MHESDLSAAIPSWRRVRIQVLIAALLVSMTVIMHMMIDRGRLLDNTSYLDYFRHSDPKYWLHGFSTDDWQALAISLVTEEIVWLSWTWVISFLARPEQAVLITAIMISLIMFLACRKTENPTLAYMIWILIPSGLFVTGLFQIRQGFAFAIFLHGCLSGRPLISSVIAAGIHSSMAIPMIAILIGKIPYIRNNPVFMVMAALIFAAVFSLAGNAFFTSFGGRRVSEYEFYDSAVSLNFVFGSLIALVFYISSLLEISKNSEHQKYLPVAMAGTTVSALSIFAFFWFPLATARVSYYQVLLLIPMLFRSRITSSVIKINLSTTLVAAMTLYTVYSIVQHLSTLNPYE